jgi:class 3 adenylate cyclase
MKFKMGMLKRTTSDKITKVNKRLLVMAAFHEDAFMASEESRKKYSSQKRYSSQRSSVDPSDTPSGADTFNGRVNTFYSPQKHTRSVMLVPILLAATWYPMLVGNGGNTLTLAAIGSLCGMMIGWCFLHLLARNNACSSYYPTCYSLYMLLSATAALMISIMETERGACDKNLAFGAVCSLRMLAIFGILSGTEILSTERVLVAIPIPGCVYLLYLLSTIDTASSKLRLDLFVSEYVFFLAGVAPICVIVSVFFNRYKEMTQDMMKQTKIVSAKCIKGTDLLFCLLPEEVVPKFIERDLGFRQEEVIREYPEATILFLKLVGLHGLSKRLNTLESVSIFHELVCRFDQLTVSHSVEKIRTDFGVYLLASGLPLYNPQHALKMSLLAIALREATAHFSVEMGGLGLSCKIGINSGSVVAGVIGTTRYQYDLIGDTVNTAARMCTSCGVGDIRITKAAYELVKDSPGFSFVDFGEQKIKGKAMMHVYHMNEAPGGDIARLIGGENDNWGYDTDFESTIASTKSWKAPDYSTDTMKAVQDRQKKRRSNAMLTIEKLIQAHHTRQGGRNKGVGGKEGEGGGGQEGIGGDYGGGGGSILADSGSSAVNSAIVEYGVVTYGWLLLLLSLAVKHSHAAFACKLPSDAGLHLTQSPASLEGASTIFDCIFLPMAVLVAMFYVHNWRRGLQVLPGSEQSSGIGTKFQNKRESLKIVPDGGGSRLKEKSTAVAPGVLECVLQFFMRTRVVGAHWSLLAILIAMAARVRIHTIQIEWFLYISGCYSFFLGCQPREFMVLAVVASVVASLVLQYGVNSLSTSGLHQLTEQDRCSHGIKLLGTYTAGWCEPNWMEHWCLQHLVTALVTAVFATHSVAKRFRVPSLVYDQERRHHQQKVTELKLLEDILAKCTPPMVLGHLRNEGESQMTFSGHGSIMFADIVNFTPFSSRLTPLELAQFLNGMYMNFDQLAAFYSIEKIKTVGDCYVGCSGVMAQSADHAEMICAFGCEMQHVITALNAKHAAIVKQTGVSIQMRIGVHTGQFVGGVIGSEKFGLDLWGTSVTIAQKMEECGKPGWVSISSDTLAEVTRSRGCMDVFEIERYQEVKLFEEEWASYWNSVPTIGSASELDQKRKSNLSPLADDRQGVQRAALYRKTATVHAFKSDDAFDFYKKSWGKGEDGKGLKRSSGPGSWLIINPGSSSTDHCADMYGAEPAEFDDIYTEAVDLGTHQYRKQGKVLASKAHERFVLIIKGREVAVEEGDFVVQRVETPKAGSSATCTSPGAAAAADDDGDDGDGDGDESTAVTNDRKQVCPLPIKRRTFDAKRRSCISSPDAMGRRGSKRRHSAGAISPTETNTAEWFPVGERWVVKGEEFRNMYQVDDADPCAFRLGNPPTLQSGGTVPVYLLREKKKTSASPVDLRRTMSPERLDSVEADSDGDKLVQGSPSGSDGASLETRRKSLSFKDKSFSRKDLLPDLAPLQTGNNLKQVIFHKYTRAETQELPPVVSTKTRTFDSNTRMNSKTTERKRGSKSGLAVRKDSKSMAALNSIRRMSGRNKHLGSEDQRAV